LALRNITVLGADSTLHGMWGTVGSLPMWIRDDRMGGLERAGSHFESLGSDESLWQASLAEKRRAKDNWNGAMALFMAEIAPALTDSVQSSFLASSIRYGQHLFGIIDAAWRVMAEGYRKDNGVQWSSIALQQAIADYDSAFFAYRAYGLAEPYAPSLYHDYYLCLGTDCTGALDPSPHPDGIGNTVNRYRSTVPSTPPPQEQCREFSGFVCGVSQYCSTSGSRSMENYDHSGGETLADCERLCAKDTLCTCFIHTPSPSDGSELCKTVKGVVTGTYPTAHGNTMYLRKSPIEFV